MGIEIYTDGSCLRKKNQNPGGFAFYIKLKEEDKNGITGGGSEKETTNQRMELTACIKALDQIVGMDYPKNSVITIYTDSAYICNCFAQRWYDSWEKNGWKNSKKEPVKNRDLWEKLIEHYRYFDLSIKKVKGHSGVEGNEIVDNLANTLAQSAVIYHD